MRSRGWGHVGEDLKVSPRPAAPDPGLGAAEGARRGSWSGGSGGSGRSTWAEGVEDADAESPVEVSERKEWRAAEVTGCGPGGAGSRRGGAGPSGTEARGGACLRRRPVRGRRGARRGRRRERPSSPGAARPRRLPPGPAAQTPAAPAPPSSPSKSGLCCPFLLRAQSEFSGGASAAASGDPSFARPGGAGTGRRPAARSLARRADRVGGGGRVVGTDAPSSFVLLPEPRAVPGRGGVGRGGSGSHFMAPGPTSCLHPKS